jgi:hypothetical protein
VSTHPTPSESEPDIHDPPGTFSSYPSPPPLHRPSDRLAARTSNPLELTRITQKYPSSDVVISRTPAEDKVIGFRDRTVEMGEGGRDRGMAGGGRRGEGVWSGRNCSVLSVAWNWILRTGGNNTTVEQERDPHIPITNKIITPNASTTKSTPSSPHYSSSSSPPSPPPPPSPSYSPSNFPSPPPSPPSSPPPPLTPSHTSPRVPQTYTKPFFSCTCPNLLWNPYVQSGCRRIAIPRRLRSK